MSLKTAVLASAFALPQLVAGHSVITNAVGNAGGAGMGLGCIPGTPRNGIKNNPFQRDATFFHPKARFVGQTIKGGINKIQQGTKNIMSYTHKELPQITPGGQLRMTLHQVNFDGAGPYKCWINADGSALSWEAVKVIWNVGGKNGINPNTNHTPHPLWVTIPAKQNCTGKVAGQDRVCLVRCQNTAKNGPFGGVVPCQMPAGGFTTPVVETNAPTETAAPTAGVENSSVSNEDVGSSSTPAPASSTGRASSSPADTTPAASTPAATGPAPTGSACGSTK